MRKVVCVLLPTVLWGITYIASTAQEIQQYTDMLHAGDTLLVQNGQYDLNWKIRDLSGTSTDWIVINNLGGNVLIVGTAYDNVINVNNCYYVHFDGFELTTSNPGDGIDGIKFKSYCDHFNVVNCHMHDLTGCGIAANSDDIDYLIIKHCHIHDIGGSVGEGIYLGSHDGSCKARHCIVEWNWIHDTNPKKGIQIKRSSYLNIIQDNVVYNNSEAGIVLYRTDRSSINDNNIVRRNVVWNTPEGIFAVGETDIDNNIIFECSYGINVRNYGGWGMEDLRIRNNTIYHCDAVCLMLDDWNISTGEMICANNACYQDSLNHNAIRAPNGIGSGIVENNRHYGTSQVGGSTLGNPPDQEFISISTTPGVIDLYPKDNATLLDSGTDQHGVPDDDFNLKSRPYSAYWDVGGYEWSQTGNPGWQIKEGFKEVTPGIEQETYLTDANNKVLRVFPNPSGNKVTISFHLPHKTNIDLSIYNISGQLVKKLVDKTPDYLSYQKSWNTSGYSNGIYFVKLKADRYYTVEKLIIIND